MIFPRTASPLSFSVGPVRRLPYMPALDGLRAIAVVAVMIYHADEAWLPGGYLGVEVFFAISGYLITALLISEFDRTDRIDFLAFWKRRARRLLPALGVLLVGVAMLAVFTAPDALGSLWGQSTAALAYVMNWSLIATEQSYFESFGRPPLLQHLWSLAIEEQFYLLMPALFLAGRRLLGRRLTLVAVLVGAGLSTAAMWTRFDPLADPSRLYYGTDTRAAGILVGVALAMVWRPWAAGPAWAERLRSSPIPDLVGLACLGILLTQLVTLGAYDARLYRGGFLLVAVLTLGIVAAVSSPGSLLAVPLSIRPLRWIGLRSYGLYLWHWPVFMVLRPGVDTIVADPWLTLLRIAATVGLAELSYTYIEVPVREGRFGDMVSGLLRSAPEASALRRGVAVLGVTVVAVAAIGNVQLGRSPAVAAPRDMPTEAQLALRTIPKPVAGLEDPITATDPAPAPTAEPEPEPAGPAPEFDRVFVIGDSVMVGAEEELATIDGAVVDAAIGRQWHEVVDLEGVDPGPRDAVVIHLGNNGAATTATIDAVLDHMSGAARVVLVTVRVPRPWESTVNRSLSGATGRWPNTVLADWHTAADGSPGYFGGDGVHLNGSGARALLGTITYALDLPLDEPLPPPSGEGATGSDLDPVAAGPAGDR